MPVYEYKCKRCHRQIEVTQKITDAPLSTCSSCGGELKKLITSTSFLLKGSGWHVTDYPSGDRKKAMEAKKEVSHSGDLKHEKKDNTQRKEAVESR